MTTLANASSSKSQLSFWKNDGFSDNVRWLPNGHVEKGALTLLLIKVDIIIKIEINPLT
jgi:hypothetical protein